MKKLLALLLACMTLTCTFASCGDTDDDEKDTNTKKSAKADEDEEDEEDEEDTDEDDEDEEDTDEEEEEEEETKKSKKSKKDEDEDDGEEEETEEETEEEAEEETTKKSSKKASKSDSDACGVWLVGDVGSGLDGGIVIKDDGTVSIRVDASSVMYFDYPTMNLSGMELGEDYIDYDGDDIVVSEEGIEIMTLSRKSGTKGSAASYDGSYDFTSGIMYDSMIEAFATGTGGSGNVACSAYIDGTTFYIDFDEMLTYTVTGDGTADVTGSSDIFGSDFNGGEVTYEVDGDTLILKSDAGDEVELTRWD